MLKRFAQWVLRKELDSLEASVREGKELAQELARAAREAVAERERLGRLLDAKDNWNRLCELLTDARDVEEAMRMAAPQWQQAVAAMERNHPGLLPPQAHVIGVVRRAMREALHGLLSGQRVRFHFTVDRDPNRSGGKPIDLGAHVFVDRAEFHAITPSYLVPKEDSVERP